MIQRQELGAAMQLCMSSGPAPGADGLAVSAATSSSQRTALLNPGAAGGSEACKLLQAALTTAAAAAAAAAQDSASCQATCSISANSRPLSSRPLSGRPTSMLNPSPPAAPQLTTTHSPPHPCSISARHASLPGTDTRSFRQLAGSPLSATPSTPVAVTAKEGSISGQQLTVYARLAARIQWLEAARVQQKLEETREAVLLARTRLSAATARAQELQGFPAQVSRPCGQQRPWSWHTHLLSVLRRPSSWFGSGGSSSAAHEPAVTLTAAKQGSHATAAGSGSSAPASNDGAQLGRLKRASGSNVQAAQAARGQLHGDAGSSESQVLMVAGPASQPLLRVASDTRGCTLTTPDQHEAADEVLLAEAALRRLQTYLQALKVQSGELKALRVQEARILSSVFGHVTYTTSTPGSLPGCLTDVSNANAKSSSSCRVSIRSYTPRSNAGDHPWCSAPDSAVSCCSSKVFQSAKAPLPDRTCSSTPALPCRHRLAAAAMPSRQGHEGEQDQGLEQGQERGPGRGQGQDQGLEQGQGQEPGQGQEQGREQGQGRGQGQSQSQGQGQGKGPGPGQGQGQHVAKRRQLVRTLSATLTTTTPRLSALRNTLPQPTQQQQQQQQQQQGHDCPGDTPVCATVVQASHASCNGGAAGTPPVHNPLYSQALDGSAEAAKQMHEASQAKGVLGALLAPQCCATSHSPTPLRALTPPSSPTLACNDPCSLDDPALHQQHHIPAFGCGQGGGEAHGAAAGGSTVHRAAALGPMDCVACQGETAKQVKGPGPATVEEQEETEGERAQHPCQDLLAVAWDRQGLALSAALASEQACQQALQRDRDRAQVTCELLEGAMSKANMAALKVEKALVAGLMAQGESDAGSRAKVARWLHSLGTPPSACGWPTAGSTPGTCLGPHLYKAVSDPSHNSGQAPGGVEAVITTHHGCRSLSLAGLSSHLGPTLGHPRRRHSSSSSTGGVMSEELGVGAAAAAGGGGSRAASPALIGRRKPGPAQLQLSFSLPSVQLRCSATSHSLCSISESTVSEPDQDFPDPLAGDWSLHSRRLQRDPGATSSSLDAWRIKVADTSITAACTFLANGGANPNAGADGKLCVSRSLPASVHRWGPASGALSRSLRRSMRSLLARKVAPGLLSGCAGTGSPLGLPTQGGSKPVSEPTGSGAGVRLPGVRPEEPEHGQGGKAPRCDEMGAEAALGRAGARCKNDPEYRGSAAMAAGSDSAAAAAATAVAAVVLPSPAKFPPASCNYASQHNPGQAGLQPAPASPCPGDQQGVSQDRDALLLSQALPQEAAHLAAAGASVLQAAWSGWLAAGQLLLSREQGEWSGRGGGEAHRTPSGVGSAEASGAAMPATLKLLRSQTISVITALQCLQACCALSAHLCLEARAAKSLAAATEQKLDRCGLAVAAGKLRLLQHQRKLLLKLASGSGARGGALQAAGLGPTGAAGARWQGQAGEQEAGSPQRHADVR